MSKSLSSMEKLKKMFDESAMPEYGVTCVYRLIDSAGVVIYVGQSRNLQSRLITHLGNGMDFVDFDYSLVPEDGMNAEESEQIVMTDSALNTSLPSNNTYLNRSTVKANVSAHISRLINKLPTVFHRVSDRGMMVYNYVHVGDQDRLMLAIDGLFTEMRNEHFGVCDIPYKVTTECEDLLYNGVVVRTYDMAYKAKDKRKRIIADVALTPGISITYDDIVSMCGSEGNSHEA